MSYEILEMKVPKNLIKERIGDGKSCEFFCKLLLGLSKLGSNSLALVLECCFDNIVFCAFILGWWVMKEVASYCLHCVSNQMK